MTRLIVFFMLFASSATSIHSQDDDFDSRLPKSKQAMFVIDVALADILKNPLVSPFLTDDLIREFGPFETKDFRNINRLTVYLGVPDLTSPDVDFVTRIKLEDKTAIPAMLKTLFGGEELRSQQEEGWTVLKPARRFPGFPEVIRHRENMLEFGSSLYTFTPSRTLASKALSDSFGALDKDASLRMAFDAQVLATLMKTVMVRENSKEDAVYSMVKWGEFVNESSLLLYAIQLLSDLESASLSVSLDRDSMAQLSIVPVSGKEDIVKSRAKVLYDFAKFHIDLPIAVFKTKESPVADILEKLADGFQISTGDSKISLTLQKPKDLGKSLLATIEKMKGSFSVREDFRRMQMLALSAHNYHDTRKRFPFVPDKRFAERSSPDLSWRVRVLPYIEENSTYDRMDHSKGWDAKVNMLFSSKCKDNFFLSNGALICNIVSDRPAISFGSILDGSSNTIMLIENRNIAMTPWTKPTPLTVDEAVELAFKLKKGDSLWISLYDGSVRKLLSPKDSGATKDELRGLFHPSDMKYVEISDFTSDGRPTLFPEIRRPRRGGFGAAKKVDVDFGVEAAVPEPARPRDEKKRDVGKKEEKKFE